MEKEYVRNINNGWRGEVIDRRFATHKGKREVNQKRVKYLGLSNFLKKICGTDTFWENTKSLRKCFSG